MISIPRMTFAMAVAAALSGSVAAAAEGEGGATRLLVEAGETVPLTVGFADILQVDGVVSTIVLGEPAVADASPLDAGTILLTGRTAGVTNMIALDAEGRILADVMLRVGGRQPGAVTVRRGTETRVYSCTAGLCEGDAPDAGGGDPAQQAAALASSSQ